MFKFDLLENEKLEKMIRQTEAVLFKPVLLVFVFIYVPWYFIIKYELLNQFYRLLFAWTILVFLYAVYKYLIWLLNVYLVTNKRLVVVSYQNLVRKKIAECGIDRIANISVSTTGTVSTLFGYGDVEIQIMNTEQTLLLKNTSQPAKIKDYIWKMHSHITATSQYVAKTTSQTLRVAQPINPIQKRKIV
jgi:hypothetical protein